MRNIGFMIVGGNVGIAWATVFAKHGHAYSSREGMLALAMGLVVYTVLVFA